MRHILLYSTGEEALFDTMLGLGHLKELQAE